jgi:integrase
MDETMLVNEYAQKVISERQYKYQTRQSYLKGIKAIGIWDMEVTSLSPQLFYEKLDSIPNLNTRRSITIVCKSVFKDLGICKDLKIIDGIPRTYDLPSQNDLHRLIDRSIKYRNYLYLCMYAGLRVGEACAITPKSVIKEGHSFWLSVDKAWSQDGKNLGTPKTIGKVMIPKWLADQVLAMTDDEIWKKGMPTQLISWACCNLSKKGEKIHINPHMLRHWFATDMIRRQVPVHIVMRQMRHKNINTTMKIYAQVHNSDFVDALPTRPEDKAVSMGNVVNLFN